MSTTPARAGAWLILAAALLWSLLGLITRTLLDQGFTPLQIAFYRAALASIPFVAHALLARPSGARRAPRSARDAFELIAFALIGVTLFYTALARAIEAGGISLAFILLYTAPIFVALLAWPLLGERPTAATGAAVALAVAGVVAVAAGGGAGGASMTLGFAALAWGLTAGASYASYYLLGKSLLERYRPAALFAWVLPIGAMALWPLAGIVAAPSPAAWLPLLASALLCTYLAYWLYSLGLQRSRAVGAVLIATLEPVAAALWAALFFAESLGLWGIVGGALVLSAALIPQLATKGR